MYVNLKLYGHYITYFFPLVHINGYKHFIAGELFMNLHRKKVRSPYRSESNAKSRAGWLVRGIMTSLIITIPVFLILSAAMTITEFPEEYMSPAVLITIVVSIIIASLVTTAPAENCGWIGGSIAGLFYMLVIAVIRWILESRIYIDKDIITLILSGVLLGTISGMLGLVLGKKIRNTKRRKRSA